ncbi:MAG: DUF4132 domain-containing protein [Firmicutes bacterium]|nr:DUF4132 domain-containing protein [Bacillota bacterium]
MTESEIKRIVALTQSKFMRDHQKVLDLLRSAGNQIGVFDQVFCYTAYQKFSDEFRRFIIPKILEFQYYRYKVVVDAIRDGYDLGYEFPIGNGKEFIIKVNDMLSGNYQKYWDSTDTKIVYMMLRLLTGNPYNEFFVKSVNSKDKNVKLIALYHLAYHRPDTIKLRLCERLFDQDDLEFYAPLLSCIVVRYEQNRSYGDNRKPLPPTPEEQSIFRSLYPKLKVLYDRLPKKTVHYNATEEVWISHEVTKVGIYWDIVRILESLGDKSLIRDFEKTHYDKLDAEQKLRFINDFKPYITRDYRTEMLNYFTGYVTLYSGSGDLCKEYFKKCPLTYDEAVSVSDALKTKRTDAKKRIVEHYMQMPEKSQAKLKAYLLAAPEDYKREAAPDLKGGVEEKKIEAFEPKRVKCPEYKLPELHGYKVADAIGKLKAFVMQNRNYEYTGHGMSEPTLFGERYWEIDREGNYPLQDESDKIIEGFGFSADELVFLLYAMECGLGRGTGYYEKVTSTSLGGKIDSAIIDVPLILFHYSPMILSYLMRKGGVAAHDALLKRAIDAYGQIKEFPKNENVINYDYSGSRAKEETVSRKMLRVSSYLEKQIDYGLISDALLSDSKALAWYIRQVGVVDVASGANAYYNQNGANLLYNAEPVLYRMFERGIASLDEVKALIRCGVFNLANFFQEKSLYYHNKSRVANIYDGKHSPEFIALIENILIELTEIEIARAQADTPYSGMLARCPKFVGIRYFVLTLKAFQKATLPRSVWGWSSSHTKDDVFAVILQHVAPHKTDSFEYFAGLVKEHKLTEKDLIKGVLYNNNQTILEWTDKYLNKKGFVSAVMFFKAHLKDSEVSRGVQEKIALYSPIDILDFKEGAVDVDWFWAMKGETDEKTFQTVYDNAKYITVANNHKRAQRFNDALTGVLSAEECLAKINETRNKEFMLCYSLVPLKDEADIKTRYEVIQRFLLESKQFGAQRQTSEKKACEIALENMARGAGYEDADRFVWFMEAKEAHRIAQFFVPREIDGVSVFLRINDRFKCAVVAEKGGKELSSLPAKLKSDPYVVAMKAEVPALNKQSSRVIKSLENAMEKEGKFELSELCTIAANPVIKQILKSLFFIADGKTMLFDGEKMRPLGQGSIPCEEETVGARRALPKNEIVAQSIGQGAPCPYENSQNPDHNSLSFGLDSPVHSLYIAHPLDLFRNRTWESAQKYLLSHKIRQPFKQAFRELYPKTDDEREANETNRYHGHQVDAQKAIAVAKGRGWHAGEDIGLQKVYYKENVVAVIFGVWDFGYSSYADHPTLSSVYFLNRRAERDGSMKIIKLAEVGDKMFSEVMRDVDLIVSTSHPQGYDFEESLSTVEVRRQVCQNIAELLNLHNVSIEGHHIHIKGGMGEYAVNLRSGIAAKQLSGTLNIMAINDSTHNKVFLNFIDDNPKTAEIVSKMLLLADDKSIKDINILREIKG